MHVVSTVMSVRIHVLVCLRLIMYVCFCVCVIYMYVHLRLNIFAAVYALEGVCTYVHSFCVSVCVFMYVGLCV